MEFETWLLLAIAIRLDGIYKILSKKNNKK